MDVKLIINIHTNVSPSDLISLLPGVYEMSKINKFPLLCQFSLKN